MNAFQYIFYYSSTRWNQYCIILNLVQYVVVNRSAMKLLCTLERKPLVCSHSKEVRHSYFYVRNNTFLNESHTSSLFLTLNCWLTTMPYLKCYIGFLTLKTKYLHQKMVLYFSLIYHWQYTLQYIILIEKIMIWQDYLNWIEK